MELKITVSAKKIINSGSTRTLFKSLLEKLVGFMEKQFGSKLLLEVPLGLHRFDSHMFSAIDAIARLKRMEILKEVKKIRNLPDEPGLFRFYASSHKRAYGTGSSFTDEESAMWKSLAEATERFLWMHSDFIYTEKDKMVSASYEEVKKRAVNIFSLAGFSDEQKEKNTTIRFDKHTKFNWIPVESLVTKKTVLCPVQLLNNLYFRSHVDHPGAQKDDRRNEPMLRWAITTGLATGRSHEEALTKGILEIVERDAFIITYLNKLSPPMIDLDYLSCQDEEIKKILSRFRRYKLEVYLIQLPTDFAVHIIAAVIIDRTGTTAAPAFTIGASADFSLRECILDALSEALKICIGTREYYLSDKKANADTSAIYQRLQNWSEQNKLPLIGFLTNGTTIKTDLERTFYTPDNDKERNIFYKQQLTSLANQIKNLGYEAYFSDLTIPEVRDLGLECRYVLIPELQPLHLNENLPYFGGERLFSVPSKLDYIPAQSLNKIPHPFS